MKEIPTEEAREGDVMARDLHGGAGIAILSRGTKLSASMITRLKKMGIQQICVERAEEPGVVAAEQARFLTLLEERFQGTEDNPYLQEMKKAVAEHLKNP